MAKLSALRFFRGLRRDGVEPEFPALEALVDQEGERVSHGWRLASWIVPSAASLAGLAVFLPLTLLVHELFFIGVAGFVVVGGAFGLLSHLLDRRISPSQKRLRAACRRLGDRMQSFEGLMGRSPIAADLAALLDRGAAAYLSVLAQPELSPGWEDAGRPVRDKMEEAMIRLLEFAVSTPAAAPGLSSAESWPAALVSEMEAAAAALARTANRPMRSLAPTVLTELTEARHLVERLEEAEQELDRPLNS
ncbi:MAG: hypothetical protein MH204_09035 [Fimbriimonadaceae bacterium]|nr:hypothetical protein [Fimbriimonadaceae bacterium]